MWEPMNKASFWVELGVFGEYMSKCDEKNKHFWEPLYWTHWEVLFVQTFTNLQDDTEEFMP